MRNYGPVITDRQKRFKPSNKHVGDSHNNT